MTKSSYSRIAIWCLNKYWNAATIQDKGWDTGSPAHRYAVRWAKKNHSDLKKLSWPKIFKAYLKTLVQD